MKFVSALLLIFLISLITVQAQEKGVDQQNGRIRDQSNNRTPAVNGGNTSTGTGRGFDFGRGRTPNLPSIPNPYRFSVPNDVLTKAVRELMGERKLILDESVSKFDEGVLISQPLTFIKGAVATPSQLSRYALVPDPNPYNWTRGRYTLTIEVQPLDSKNTNLSVNATVEGRSESELGTQWITLRSSGFAEQEFIIALVEKITGGPPPGRQPQAQP